MHTAHCSLHTAPLLQAPQDLLFSDEEEELEEGRGVRSSPPPSSPSLALPVSPKLEDNNNLEASSPLLTKIKVEEGEYGEGEGEGEKGEQENRSPDETAGGKRRGPR